MDLQNRILRILLLDQHMERQLLEKKRQKDEME